MPYESSDAWIPNDEETTKDVGLFLYLAIICKLEDETKGKIYIDEIKSLWKLRVEKGVKELSVE